LRRRWHRVQLMPVTCCTVSSAADARFLFPYPSFFASGCLFSTRARSLSSRTWV
jgi:hypothetical protein